MNTHGGPHHGLHHHGTEQKTVPGWKRVHHRWIFWVGAVLTFAAIMVYVMSIDLAWRPGVRASQPIPSGAVGK